MTGQNAVDETRITATWNSRAILRQRRGGSQTAVTLSRQDSSSPLWASRNDIRTSDTKLPFIIGRETCYDFADKIKVSPNNHTAL
jgi:hypothetical protein